MSRRATPATVVLGVSLAMLGTGVWLLVDHAQEQDAGVVSSIGRRPVPSSEPVAVRASPTAPVDVASPPSSAPATPAALGRPRRIEIPAIDVDTDIVSVGLDEARAVEVPPDIRQVGWYRHAAAPGSDTGSAVLVAHRDGRDQGHGVFYDLGQLELGDRVMVTTDDGSRVRYRVVAREMIQRSAFGDAAPDLFALDGAARLTLISCGGRYDRDAGGYQANIVVTAVPDGAGADTRAER